MICEKWNVDGFPSTAPVPPHIDSSSPAGCRRKILGPDQVLLRLKTVTLNLITADPGNDQRKQRETDNEKRKTDHKTLSISTQKHHFSQSPAEW